MKRRVPFVLIGLAAALHLGVTLPTESKSLATKDEYTRLRTKRRDADRKLQVIERRLAEREQVSQILAQTPAVTPERAVPEVRRRVVETLDAAGVSKVRLEVRPPAQAPAIASITLQGEAAFFDAVGLAEALLRPTSGLVIDKFRMASTAGNPVLLEVEASAVGQLR